jgi:hypothetical protein
VFSVLYGWLAFPAKTMRPEGRFAVKRTQARASPECGTVSATEFPKVSNFSVLFASASCKAVSASAPAVLFVPSAVNPEIDTSPSQPAISK